MKIIRFEDASDTPSHVTHLRAKGGACRHYQEHWVVVARKITEVLLIDGLRLCVEVFIECAMCGEDFRRTYEFSDESKGLFCSFYTPISDPYDEHTDAESGEGFSKLERPRSYVEIHNIFEQLHVGPGLNPCRYLGWVFCNRIDHSPRMFNLAKIEGIYADVA